MTCPRDPDRTGVAGWGTEAVGVVAFLPWAGVAIAAGAGFLWLGVSPVRSVEGAPSDRASVSATD